MVLCGVEIKGSEAIFAVAELVNGSWMHIPTETKRIVLKDDDDAKNVRSFADLVAGFLRDNELTEVAIKKRSKKGEFAGGPTTFKIEGVFQINRECNVQLVAGQTIAALAKKYDIAIPTTLNKYQVDAFRTACAALAQRLPKK